jgi:hypothetical protein
MTKNLEYNKKATWQYPQELIMEIKKEILSFYKQNGHQYENFTIIEIYGALHEFIKKKTGKTIPLRWLKDFNTNQKDNKAIKKLFFEALMNIFDYDYSPLNNTFRKKNYSEQEESETPNQNDIKIRAKKILGEISVINSKMLKLFAGTYKYFLGARKDSIYDYIYENELQILENGDVRIYNPFSKHTYYGMAFTRNEKSFQILSFDYSNGKIEGIGNLISLKVNLYGKSLLLIPGISLTFDADLRPIASQVLLCSDLSISKKSKPVREYYDKITKELRFNCPEIEQVEKLRNKYFKAPINVTQLE